ncbi:MAG TPA: hypothetical protein DCL77_10125 [Prolixibacteraceae bacterium]|jgi:hypothetical protein|nr:hypothetical protein [Prolixibacteraceae bacterium]
MKKIVLFIALLSLIGLASRAQDTMFVHQKGGILTKFAVDKIDSILFKTADLSAGTTIKGYAQKGPFINGSAITVFDLQANLSPSGKSFSEQITDNKGTFELDNIELSSNFVSIRADGYYFNEVSGKQSTSQITLYALSDVSNQKSLNINILTHLEKARVEYLMKAGKTFSVSKAQAQKEILAIFNIESSTMKVSESLNINEQGDANGILLAISSLIQGFRTESEMTELLSNISTDIKTDGILNNSAIGSALINQAIALDTIAIRANLMKRYNEIGAPASIPYFGKYIKNFIGKTSFPITEQLITYPEIGLYGDNILSLTKTNYIIYNDLGVSLNAKLARGAALKIKITSLSADTIYTSLPADTIVMADTIIIIYNDTLKVIDRINRKSWGCDFGSSKNWTTTAFDPLTYTQIISASESDKECDMKMLFETGNFLIEYFEMNSTIPTRKKIITYKRE